MHIHTKVFASLTIYGFYLVCNVSPTQRALEQGQPVAGRAGGLGHSHTRIIRFWHNRGCRGGVGRGGVSQQQHSQRNPHWHQEGKATNEGPDRSVTYVRVLGQPQRGLTPGCPDALTHYAYPKKQQHWEGGIGVFRLFHHFSVLFWFFLVGMAW